MISAYLYRKECKKALVQLGLHEDDMLRKMTYNGWFNEELYLEKMDNSPYYVTKNQRKIMALCPQKYDDPDIAEEKNIMRKLNVKQMAKHNKVCRSMPSEKNRRKK